jgi:CubicO group peptidase (beta-lactamase class C family)
MALVLQSLGPTAHAQSPAASRLSLIDAAVDGAIADHKMPGAVVVVGHNDTIVYRKAFGQRAIVPAAEPMTLDTVFDLASLTKVVATTTAVMSLVEDGKIRLVDSVASFIPEFGKYGKDRITVRHLMTHMSGLRPDVDLGDQWTGHDAAIRLAGEEVLTQAPGAKFVYSDINYFLLAEIVQRVSKQPFEQFVQTRIFKPLGMTHTGFVPAASLRSRIAPTEPCALPGGGCTGTDTTMLRGVVHDPTARRMGGVAGHAGLFSTADDLALFCRMLLNGGMLPGGARILSPLSVARMTSPSTPAGEANIRGLGWDLDSSFASNRGDLLPLGSFGHTGFTGTSIWIDPATKTFVIILANRVHPDGKGDASPLRARVATIVASTLTDVAPATATQLMWSRHAFDSQTLSHAAGVLPVQTGIDVLAASGFAALKAARGPRHQHTAWRATASRRSICSITHEDADHSGARHEARRALQPGARHSRHSRREHSVHERREDRAAHSLALRRHAASDGRDARGHRRDGDRPAGRRRALLHVHDHDGLRDGGGRRAQDQSLRARSAQSDWRRRHRRSRARCRHNIVRRLLSGHADSPWPDDG